MENGDICDDSAWMVRRHVALNRLRRQDANGESSSPGVIEAADKHDNGSEDKDQDDAILKYTNLEMSANSNFMLTEVNG